MNCARNLLYGIAIAGAACNSAVAQPARLEPIQLAAQVPRGPGLDEQSAKQNRIFSARGDEVPAGYVVDRSLLAYVFFLRAGFTRALANLGPTDRWLDIGAGEGRAILDYHSERYDVLRKDSRERHGKKAQAVALSIEDRRTATWEHTAARLPQDQIQYRHGKRLRDYTVEDLGRFQLITDLLGGFTYTQNLGLFMEDVLNLLEMNGRFYSMLQHVQYEHAPSGPIVPSVPNGSVTPVASFQTEIVDAGGSAVKICSWLKRITCVEVACEQKPQGTLPIEAYRVRKVCNEVTVPPLVTLQFEAGAPPQRRFMLGESPARAGTAR